MKLTELNPKFADSGAVKSHLIIDCPICKGHKIAIPINPELPGGQCWTMTGDSFANLNLTPSILHKTAYADWPKTEARNCESHFFITDGEIKIC